MKINDTNIDITVHNPSFKIYNVLVDVVRIAHASTSTGLRTTEDVLISNMEAHIKWHSGKERLQFDKVTAFRDATLQCRMQSVAITTKNRIRFKGEDFEIVSVVDRNNLGLLLLIDIKRID